MHSHRFYTCGCWIPISRRRACLSRRVKCSTLIFGDKKLPFCTSSRPPDLNTPFSKKHVNWQKSVIFREHGNLDFPGYLAIPQLMEGENSRKGPKVHSCGKQVMGHKYNFLIRLHKLNVQGCMQSPAVATAAAASDGNVIEAAASAEDNRLHAMKLATEKNASI